jgi:hypothetical protein
LAYRAVWAQQLNNRLGNSRAVARGQLLR